MSNENKTHAHESYANEPQELRMFRSLPIAFAILAIAGGVIASSGCEKKSKRVRRSEPNKQIAVSAEMLDEFDVYCSSLRDEREDRRIEDETVLENLKSEEFETRYEAAFEYFYINDEAIRTARIDVLSEALDHEDKSIRSESLSEIDKICEYADRGFERLRQLEPVFDKLLERLNETAKDGQLLELETATRLAKHLGRDWVGRMVPVLESTLRAKDSSGPLKDRSIDCLFSLGPTTRDTIPVLVNHLESGDLDIIGAHDIRLHLEYMEADSGTLALLQLEILESVLKVANAKKETEADVPALMVNSRHGFDEYDDHVWKYLNGSERALQILEELLSSDAPDFRFFATVGLGYVAPIDSELFRKSIDLDFISLELQDPLLFRSHIIQHRLGEEEVYALIEAELPSDNPVIVLGAARTLDNVMRESSSSASIRRVELCKTAILKLVEYRRHRNANENAINSESDEFNRQYLFNDETRLFFRQFLRFAWGDSKVKEPEQAKLRAAIRVDGLDKIINFLSTEIKNNIDDREAIWLAGMMSTDARQLVPDIVDRLKSQHKKSHDSMLVRTSVAALAEIGSQPEIAVPAIKESVGFAKSVNELAACYQAILSFDASDEFVLHDATPYLFVHGCTGMAAQTLQRMGPASEPAADALERSYKIARSYGCEDLCQQLFLALSSAGEEGKRRAKKYASDFSMFSQGTDEVSADNIDHAFDVLAVSTTLKTVELLGKAKIEDKTYASISKIESLEALILPRSATDEALRHFSGMTNAGLKRLELHGSISGTGLEHLTNLERLEILWIAKSNISDQGIVHLLGLEDLWFLNLESEQLTIEGLGKLSGLKNLETMRLVAPRISYAELDSFLKENPHIKKVWTK